MTMKSITAIQFCCYFFFVKQQRFVLYVFFVRKIVTTPSFFLFRSNIMHVTDSFSWGKLNHLIKFFNGIT